MHAVHTARIGSEIAFFAVVQRRATTTTSNNSNNRLNADRPAERLGCCRARRNLDAALADQADEKAPRVCIPNARCDSIDATRAAVTLQHVALSRPPVVLCATFQPTTRGRPNFLLKQSLRIANDVPKAQSRQQNLTCQSRPCWCFQWSRCRPLVSANGRADPATLTQLTSERRNRRALG